MPAPTAITIRVAEEDDIFAMAEMRAQEWQDRSFWIGRISAYQQGKHSPGQALPERAIFAAIEDKQVVGFVAGHRTRRLGCDGELQWINVALDKRGQGIAHQLLARIGAWFVEQRAYRICVNVDPQNATARRLYSRCGALPLNEHWMVWEDARQMSNGD